METPRALHDRRRVLEVAEANALLPVIRPLAARIRRRVALMQRQQREMLVLQLLCEASANHTNPDPDLLELVEKSVRFHRLRGQVRALVERCDDLGATVRDQDTSHVDFTFLRDDGLALLCWRWAEESVGYWHYMHEAHAARRPLRRAER